MSVIGTVFFREADKKGKASMTDSVCKIMDVRKYISQMGKVKNSRGKRK
jgi:hypothetical protein